MALAMAAAAGNVATPSRSRRPARTASGGVGAGVASASLVAAGASGAAARQSSNAAGPAIRRRASARRSGCWRVMARRVLAPCAGRRSWLSWPATTRVTSILPVAGWIATSATQALHTMCSAPSSAWQRTCAVAKPLPRSRPSRGATEASMAACSTTWRASSRPRASSRWRRRQPTGSSPAASARSCHRLSPAKTWAALSSSTLACSNACDGACAGAGVSPSTVAWPLAGAGPERANRRARLGRMAQGCGEHSAGPAAGSASRSTSVAGSPTRLATHTGRATASDSSAASAAASSRSSACAARAAAPDGHATTSTACSGQSNKAASSRRIRARSALASGGSHSVRRPSRHQAATRALAPASAGCQRYSRSATGAVTAAGGPAYAGRPAPRHAGARLARACRACSGVTATTPAKCSRRTTATTPACARASSRRTLSSRLPR
ncbi:hypothetical protein LMG26696_05193 [Achromobacter pulmonis]|nr:hypothetical protein LMG26696_05193 [Achromobacter pulmonis]